MLRRRWWVVVALTLLGALAGALPTPARAVEVTVSKWTASHTLLLATTSDAQTIYSDPTTFYQLQLFATTGEVPKRVAEQVEYDGPPAALAAQVSVVADQQSGALRISTTQDSAEQVVLIADAFADTLTQYLAERQDTLRENRLTATLQRLDSLEGDVVSLEAQLADNPDDAVLRSKLDAQSRQYSVVFEQYGVLQADTGQLVLTTLERAQPISVSTSSGTGLAAPKSRLTRGLFGGIVGAIAGVGVALLLGQMDRRIRTREQAEAVFGLRSQVVVPVVAGTPLDVVAVAPDRHDPISDAYRTMRSVIGFVEGNQQRDTGRAPVVLVVSASSADGKTTVASNLAAAWAETGSATIAINADFRRPSLAARLLGAKPLPLPLLGYDDIAAMPAAALLRDTPFTDMRLLDLAGVEGSPGELARATASLLPQLTGICDVVVIDSSPVGATAEVLELVPLADVVVLVARLGHTAIDAASRTIEIVRTLSSSDLLLVLLGTPLDRAERYYEYGKVAPERRRLVRRKG